MRRWKSSNGDKMDGKEEEEEEGFGGGEHLGKLVMELENGSGVMVQ